MVDGLWLVGLILMCLLGAFLTVIHLPGTWLVVAATAAYSWHFDWTRPGWQVLAALVGLAVVAEIVEFLASTISARRAGASRRASWCALLGGIAGMLVFTIPLPIIGTILGGMLGCFLGAATAELTLKDDLAHGAKVGFWAAIGQLIGMVAKTMISLLMAATAIVAVLVRGG